MISQQQSQKLQFKILPQQIQLLNLYFLNAQELQQRISNELEENPFLDQNEETPDSETDARTASDVQDYQDYDEYLHDDRPDHRTEHQNYFDSSTAPDRAIVNTISFREEAKRQLALMAITQEELEMACYLVDVLGSDGLMTSEIADVADELSFRLHRLVEPEEVMQGLSIVKTLEPTGIGAKNIKECLLMQLRKMTECAIVKCAITLLESHYDDLLHRQFEQLQRTMKMDNERFRAALDLIGKLKFRPVAESATEQPKQTIIPDFLVTNYNDNIQVHLYNAVADSVFINQSLFDQLSTEISNKDKSAQQYVKGKISSANWFVNAIRQREGTMMAIMRCIVSMQRDYFLTGDIQQLRPMVLRNIQEQTGYDIAVISRITGNKYASTPFGIIYLKKLFSEGITDKKGQVISNKVIQSMIADAISSEDRNRPYTDQDLVNLLVAGGYNIARRTVAKYREQLHIPIAQVRAIWA
jgi:RNA polymerase sigma-54 factor